MMRHSHPLLLLCLLPLLLVLKAQASASTLRIVPGSSLVLGCLPKQWSLDSGAITWRFNGAVVPAGSLVDNGKGLELSVSPVSADSRGTYECDFMENNIEWKKTYHVEVDDTSSYTLKIPEGIFVTLPCDRPESTHSTTFALWFREAPGGQRTRLTPVEAVSAADPAPGERLEWVYGDPQFSDQSVKLHQVNMGDAGVYHCQSEKGERFNTIELLVEAAPVHSCHGSNTSWEQCPDENSRSWAAILEESLTEFSMNVYAHLSRLEPTKNLLFSPISMSGALSHLLLGARNTTRKHLEDALRLPHHFYCVHSQMKKLKENLQDSLKMASQIYYNADLKLSESFTNQSLQFYDAEPVKLTQNNADNVKMINSWVAKQTNNKIKQLVDSVSSDTQLFLLNAVYFNGQWKVKFDAKGKTAPFVKLDGDIVQVPVLYSSKYMVATEFISTLKAQVARFPLSGKTSLYVVLPLTHKLSDLQLVEGKMTDEAIRQMVKELKAVSPRATEVTLPKIQLDVKTGMNSLLQSLGLSSLFENANLCGINAERSLVLSEARHRAFLALTEVGVEAGAATSLSFSRSMSVFSILRPFILVLWSDSANQPLFLGRVTKP